MTRESLLRTIAAHPDEDTPRLAFADWLDEFGDATDRAHAELIRAQIALARLPLDDDLRAELWARSDSFRYNSAIRERLDIPRSIDYDWERGFPLRAMQDWNNGRKGHFTEADLAEVAEAMDRLPITKFTGDVPGLGTGASSGLPSPGESELELLAAWPQLARLYTLELSTGITPHEDRGDFAPGLRALARSPFTINLRRLHLAGYQVDSAALVELAHSPHLTRLTELGLMPDHYGGASEGALNELLRTPLAARLERLSCAWLEMGGQSARDWLDAAPLRALAFGLPQPEESPVGVGPLLGAPGLTRLRELHITGEEHGFGVDEMPGDDDRRVIPHLTELLTSDALGGLDVLKLKGIALGDDGARAFASGASARSVVELDLSLCGLTGDGLRALRPLLADGRLRRLSLAYNLFIQADAEEMASWPEFGRLHYLEMGYFNYIEDEGRAALKASPHRHPFLNVS